MKLHQDPFFNTTKIRYVARGSGDQMGYHSFKVEGHVQYIGNSINFPIIPLGYSPINHTIIVQDRRMGDVDETTLNLLLRGNIGWAICRFYR